MVTLAETLIEIWRQSLAESGSEVVLGEQHSPVRRTRALGLRTVAFEFQGHALEGIEQNPEKTSRWAQLAREGKRIMQFRYRARFFANVCEGSVMRYPIWKSLGLPE